MRKIDLIKDHAGEQIVIHKSQEVGGILAENHRDRMNQGSVNSGGVLGRKVASVPIDVLDSWIEEGVDYRLMRKDPAMRKKVLAKLNSPENKFLRTYDGNIG